MAKTITVPIPEPELGFITFQSYQPAYRVTCRLGDGSPTVTGGYAGWSDVTRPRRRALTEWTGSVPMTIDIPILFDDFRAGKSIEDDVKRLEHMAGWGLIGPAPLEPPLLSFNSAGVVPHDQINGSTHDWFIDNIQWGDADRNSLGHRTRQAATVTVKQFVEDDTLSDRSAAERSKIAKALKKKKGHVPKKKLYIVTEADVKKGGLRHIAAMKLGKRSRWREIAKLNKIRDPKKIHKGQHLIMP